MRCMWYFPEGQGLHRNFPATSAKVPNGQGWHACPPPYRPTGQRSQAMDSLAPVNLPGGHATQWSQPALENVPTVQVTHPAPARPAAHPWGGDTMRRGGWKSRLLAWVPLRSQPPGRRPDTFAWLMWEVST